MHLGRVLEMAESSQARDNYSTDSPEIWRSLGGSHFAAVEAAQLAQRSGVLSLLRRFCWQSSPDGVTILLAI
jgi:hypothetical protein